MRRRVVGVGRLLLAVMVATPLAARAASAQRADAPCTVERVTDGDTLRCTDGRRIRLLLIDTPEMAQRPWGQRARTALERLAPPRTVLRVETDADPRDRNGRVLGYLYTDRGTFVNRELVAGGWAVAYDDRRNRRHAATMRDAESAARRAKVGLWPDGGLDCRPIDFRRDRCR
jgi:micrococcal nuclease